MTRKVREDNAHSLEITRVAAHRRQTQCINVQEGVKRKGTHGLSLPPVTISPSRRVVYMANTGPLWALATILHSMWSFHTQTSPLTVPVNVKLFWKGVGKINSSKVQIEFKEMQFSMYMWVFRLGYGEHGVVGETVDSRVRKPELRLLFVRAYLFSSSVAY